MQDTNGRQMNLESAAISNAGVSANLGVEFLAEIRVFQGRAQRTKNRHAVARAYHPSEFRTFAQPTRLVPHREP
jgi:hypothetical protein